MRQADAPFPRRHPRLVVERDDEAQRPNEVRRVLQQAPPLVQRLIDEPEIAMLEIAQTAMDQLRRFTAGAGSEVALVDQGDAKAAQDGVERHAGAGDAAAQDEQVEGSIRQRLGLPLHAQ